MNKNTTLSVAVLIALAIGFAGYSLGSNQTPSIGTYMMSSGGIDLRFIEQMIPHHEGAIAMANIALERSKRPEIITLANNIIKAQEKEITDMRSWYQSWYGTSVPTTGGMGMHMDSMTGDTDVLESVSAADFDREFINEMIPHHEMAVMMAQMLAAGTDRAEMIQLASNVITSQSNEIEMMSGWLKSWYSN